MRGEGGGGEGEGEAQGRGEQASRRWPIAAEVPPADAPLRARLVALIDLAGLAPSLRNSQPWELRITGDDAVELRLDRRRLLPIADPEGRGAITSCGALLGALEVGARASGMIAAIDRLPDPGDPDLLARLRIVGARAPEAEETWMFQALPKRRTQRGVMARQAISPALLGRLEALAAAHGAILRRIDGPAERRTLVDLIVEGDRRQRADPAFCAELAAAVVGDPEPSGDLGAGMPAHRGELAAIRAGAATRLRTFAAAPSQDLSEGTDFASRPEDRSQETGDAADDDVWIPDERKAILDLGDLDLLDLADLEGSDPGEGDPLDEGAWIRRLRPVGDPESIGELRARPRATAIEVTIGGRGEVVDPGEGLAPAADAATIDAGAPLFAILCVAGDDGPRAWLRAGEALIRVLLRGRVDHLHASFFGQPIELPELRAALEGALDLRATPQMILRFGHAGDAPATPRRALGAILSGS